MANIHEIKNRFERHPSRVTDDELEQLLASTADDIARYVIHGDLYPERVPEYAPHSKPRNVSTSPVSTKPQPAPSQDPTSNTHQPPPEKGPKMTVDPRQLTQSELDEHLHQLIAAGDEDSEAFHTAYREWELRNS